MLSCAHVPVLMSVGTVCKRVCRVCKNVNGVENDNEITHENMRKINCNAYVLDTKLLMPRLADCRCWLLTIWTLCPCIQGLLGQTAASGSDHHTLMGSIPHPRGYVALQASTPPTIDGHLEDDAWREAPWSEAFVDITGNPALRPTRATRVKMLWDATHLYVGAHLEEPQPWATLTLHDSVIFHDNDFEIFIDPDGDNAMYYEVCWDVGM